MSGWRLLLTRPVEDCAALARTLAACGIESSSLPLLEIEPLPLDDKGSALLRGVDLYQARIVVSKPAARSLLEHAARIGLQLPRTGWFTVGAASAQILQAQGLEVISPEQGDDSEALLTLAPLREAMNCDAARVLIVRGEGGRELLAERLAEQGANVDYLELYRRRMPSYPAGALVHRVDGEHLNGLVVSSGQGLEHLQQLAGSDWSRLARLTLFVPSPRVAAQARAAGVHQIVDCRGASASALMAAVQRNAAPAS